MACGRFSGLSIWRLRRCCRGTMRERNLRTEHIQISVRSPRARRRLGRCRLCTADTCRKGNRGGPLRKGEQEPRGRGVFEKWPRGLCPMWLRWSIPRVSPRYIRSSPGFTINQAFSNCRVSTPKPPPGSSSSAPHFDPQRRECIDSKDSEFY